LRKKILIIGTSGYLGKNLKKNLSKKYKIISSHLRDRRKIDICNYKKLKNFIKINDINYLINCSGQFIEDFDKFKEISILGNKNIIDLAKNFNFKVIFCSTTSVLGNKKDDYTKIKILAENLYLKSKIDYRILRIGNVYDSGLKKKGLLRNLMLFFNNKLKNIEIKNVQNFRNFIHIDDFCSLTSIIIKNWTKYRKNQLLTVTENLKIKNIISYFVKKYPLKKINKQNLAIKNTKEGSIFINNSLVANKYFKYTKTVYLERVIKNLQFNGKYIQK
jgi:nucleoside-diphosphate-sugar epimerase